MTALTAAVDPLSLLDVIAAQRRLVGRVVKTPVRRLHWLERRIGVPVYAKLEMQQHSGSFKFRGALNAALAVPDLPLIAASAGNHGLAVAEVAQRLSRPANICIPVNASRLKRERILATGAGLIEHGTSLEQAADHARRLADQQGHYFVSPYNDPHVISGAATIATELLSEYGQIAVMVAPIGGGGLLSGLSLGADTTGGVSLFGCEPERYPSMTASLAAGIVTRVVPQPTLADGLAVNLEPDSITVGLLRGRVENIVSLTEEELAAATLALLVHESLLVEPAGAAAVVACLRLAERGLLQGPVGIPLCGGNVHHTTLARIERFPYSDPELLRLLDLRGRTVTDLPTSRTLAVASSSLAAASAQAEVDRRDDMAAQLRTWSERLNESEQRIDDFLAYGARHDLLVEPDVVNALRVDSAGAREFVLKALEDPRTWTEDQEARVEIIFRHAAHVVARTLTTLEWCSPSYDQSRVAQFFDVGAQDSPTVNYDRYESFAVQRVESQLARVLDIPIDRYATTVTSSGMAAYALIEAFLVRHRLQPGDVALLAPYVYFEASEQLATLASVRCITAASYDVDALVADVRTHRPRCLFVDSLANTADQRLVNVPRLLTELAAVEVGPLTVVIDGTMTSAALSAQLLDAGNPLEVLYYESCSKYLQLGMDTAMAGVVVAPVELTPVLDRLRRNTGAILSRHAAELFPRYDRDHFRRRMVRICANAERIAVELETRPEVRAVTEVVHPTSNFHPDHAVATTMPYAGGCVTFAFHELGANHRDQLEACIDHMLVRARRVGLHLTKGVSFGFNSPRISAAASMSETEPPFLRLYAGDRSPQQVQLLIEVVADAIARSGERMVSLD